MRIRPAAMAGLFYSGEPCTLRAEIEGYLEGARGGTGPVPKAIIAPHAGYRYSGPVAGSAYARLLPGALTIQRVILLGPAHRVAVDGIASSSADAWDTPLGRVPLDRASIDAIPQVAAFDRAHAAEHSLEVHLPFLQVVLGQFNLVPLVVGSASPASVAKVLEHLWGGPETLVVISSDLSHFLPYAEAQCIDLRTCAAIERFDGAALRRHDACGRLPIRGLLHVAEQRKLQVQTLDLRNSGDTADRRDEVVGYGAWVFNEGSP